MFNGWTCLARPFRAATGRGPAIWTFWWSSGPCPRGGYGDAYFGLLEGLEMLFGGPVDLIVDSAIRNPYFRQRVEESRTQLYAD